MKAIKYIAPKMLQFEIGSRTIAETLYAGSPTGSVTPLVKEKNAWDDEEEEWK